MENLLILLFFPCFGCAELLVLSSLSVQWALARVMTPGALTTRIGRAFKRADLSQSQQDPSGPVGGDPHLEPEPLPHHDRHLLINLRHDNHCLYRLKVTHRFSWLASSQTGQSQSCWTLSRTVLGQALHQVLTFRLPHPFLLLPDINVFQDILAVLRLSSLLLPPHVCSPSMHYSERKIQIRAWTGLDYGAHD